VELGEKGGSRRRRSRGRQCHERRRREGRNARQSSEDPHPPSLRHFPLLWVAPGAMGEQSATRLFAATLSPTQVGRASPVREMAGWLDPPDRGSEVKYGRLRGSDHGGRSAHRPVGAPKTWGVSY